MTKEEFEARFLKVFDIIGAISTSDEVQNICAELDKTYPEVDPTQILAMVMAEEIQRLQASQV